LAKRGEPSLPPPPADLTSESHETGSAHAICREPGYG
jgi:hypothetical protein